MLDVLAEALKSKEEPEERERPEEKKGSPQQALRSAALELTQKLFGRPSFAVSDQVVARRPGTEKWEEGKILSLPSPFATLPEPGSSGEAVPDGSGYYICWHDGRSMSWVRPTDVFKVTSGTRNALMATIGLFQEVTAGEAGDQSALARHLQKGADLAATDGAGYPALLLAVRMGCSLQVIQQLLDAGACADASGPLGVTPLSQAHSDALQPRLEREDAAELAQNVEALLRETTTDMDVDTDGLKSLQEAVGQRILTPILTSYAANAIPAELLDVLQLLLNGLDFHVLLDCLDATSLRAISRLLQHIVGGADGLKTALLGCRVCKALASRHQVLAQLVQCHGVLRWATWLAARKPTGPLPTAPRGHSLTSLLSGHQHQQHQSLLQQRPGSRPSRSKQSLARRKLLQS